MDIKFNLNDIIEGIETNNPYISMLMANNTLKLEGNVKITNNAGEELPKNFFELSRNERRAILKRKYKKNK